MPIELPPDYEAFKAQVISDQEADDQGVYEVWWAANSRYPELPLSTRLAIAEAVVNDLLRERRVTLVRGEWIGPRHEREAVADEQAALLDPATWLPQPGEPVTWRLTPDARSSLRPCTMRHVSALRRSVGSSGRRTGAG